MECYIVNDLMPVYIDGLVSEETKKAIERHLSECEECGKLCGKLKTPMDVTTDVYAKDEINFLKKIKKKTLRIKLISGFLAFVLIAFGVLAWIYAIGTPVSSENIILETELQTLNYEGPVNLNQEWVIHFKLTNGKAIVPRNEFVYSINEDGKRTVTGTIIKLYEAQATNMMHESDNYTWGYNVDLGFSPSADYTVTVRLKDKDIVYSMTEEGLFTPH